MMNLSLKIFPIFVIIFMITIVCVDLIKLNYVYINIYVGVLCVVNIFLIKNTIKKIKYYVQNRNN